MKNIVKKSKNVRLMDVSRPKETKHYVKGFICLNDAGGERCRGSSWVENKQTEDAKRRMQEKRGGLKDMKGSSALPTRRKKQANNAAFERQELHCR